MNEEERFLFDLQGYLKIENAIAPDALAAMNALLDAKAAADDEWKARPELKRWHDVLTWSQDFLNLLDNPVTLPYLRDILGEGLRLDHEYAIFLEAGGEGLVLHGGGTPYDPTQFYQCVNGKIFSGLTTAAFSLTDVPEGAGGFACVPGSHKSNFLCPRDIRRFERDSPMVRQVPVKAGDCMVFTEALLHGTQPYRALHPRRTIFLKYAPGYMAWGNETYLPAKSDATVAQFESRLTERQRALLAAPCVYERRSIP